MHMCFLFVFTSKSNFFLQKDLESGTTRTDKSSVLPHQSSALFIVE